MDIQLQALDTFVKRRHIECIEQGETDMHPSALKAQKTKAERYGTAVARIRELDADELAAVSRFASAHGRTWKAKLAEVYWYTARPWRGTGSQEDDGALLHGLRNDPRWGHDGLTKFRLPRAQR